jgi:hypothetical protein
MRKGMLLIMAAVVLVLYLSRSHDNKVPAPGEAPPAPPDNPVAIVPSPDVKNPDPPQAVEPPVDGPGNPRTDGATDNIDDAPPPDDADGGSKTTPMTMLSLGISMRADRDGKVNGCRGGRLVLNGPKLNFTCPPPNESKSVISTADQVKTVDKNGIELRSGEKYHFHVNDLSEEQIEKLFSDWLEQGKATSPTSQN